MSVEVMCVCGFGIGSSMLLKMNIEQVLEEADLLDQVEVTPSDITSSGGADVDLIFTSEEIGGELEGSVSAPLVIIEDFIDMDELRKVVVPNIKALLTAK